MRRIFGPLLAAAILPSTLTLMTGCKNLEKQNAPTEAAAAAPAATAAQADRNVAAIEKETEELEKEFQLFLNAQSLPGKMKLTYLERLLRIYYRAELYVEEFEKNLDEAVAKTKKDPNAKADPMDFVSYRKLVGQWMLTHRISHELEYYYKRLLETTKSEVVSAEARARASVVLEEMNQWIANLPEEDKLQLIDLFQKLDEVKKNFDTASNASGDPSRSVAAASDIALYASMDTEELQRRHKKHKKKTHQKAEATKSWRDQESDGDFAWLQFEKTDRLPSSSKIYPSAGPDGNVIGKVFPKGTFVLTYDDGPGQTTGDLLPALKNHRDAVNKNGAPATFFQLVKQVRALPDMTARTKAQFGGHLNNHSWSHANFAKSSQSQLNREIVESTSVLREVYGQKFRFFRCPYGACFAPKIPVVRDMIANLGLIHAYWAIDSLDWKNIGQPGRTAAIVKKQMAVTGRGVILFHDIHASSVSASKLLLADIAKMNAGGAKIRLVDLETAVDEVNRSAP